MERQQAEKLYGYLFSHTSTGCDQDGNESGNEDNKTLLTAMRMICPGNLYWRSPHQTSHVDGRLLYRKQINEFCDFLSDWAESLRIPDNKEGAV